MIFIRNIFIAALLISICGLYSANAQFIQNSQRSLFSDVKAFQTGDAVMVYIMEDTQADNSAETNTGRSTDLSLGVSGNVGSSGGSAGVGVGTGNKHSASGSTGRSEKIRSKLSARVIEVLDNGDLKIRGTRTTKINNEEQKIYIEGIVRRVDIAPDNSIMSYNILDLTLRLEGEGEVSEIQEPGLITKFLRLLF